ncbi:MAG: PTS sugar transporter subunit IIA [Thermaurantiacus tibetensis]|uniref:PTS sugar transporter subunit IIA n=1 Tax=Thermaurantiacus tibetensis TaxID=2759035 RepID=UPI00188EC95B|nr:PTS sugar transporter subunit IIA [Thermaurantiacus tibetensis]
MIGLVLVTHGRIGAEFLAALEHIVGAQPQCRAITIDASDDMEAKRAEIAAAAAEVDSGEGVILLTDTFGGTPSNLAISLLGRDRLEVIAGVNLPMLIKLASVRKTKGVSEAADLAQEAGRKYISVASRLLGEAA